MKKHYDSQLVEVQKELEIASRPQPVEIETFSSNYQMLQSEYEKIQRSYSQEKENLTKLESTHCKQLLSSFIVKHLFCLAKLEMDFQSLQHQNDERIEFQAKELEGFQEGIMAVAWDIDETRRK